MRSEGNSASQSALLVGAGARRCHKRWGAPCAAAAALLLAIFAPPGSARAAAQQLSPEAAARAGERLVAGVPADYSGAVPWLEQAAAGGSADGKGLLAGLLLHGWGTAADQVKGCALAIGAARDGSPIGQTYLAEMLIHGWCVKTNYARARKLLASVYDRYPPALDLLGELYLTGQGGQREPNRALDLFMLAARNGVVAADRRIATMYMLGIGVEADPEVAAKWLREGADREDAECEFRLAQLYARGIGGDRERSLLPLLRAARQGYVPAELAVGNRYMTGRGAPANWVAADYWLSRAAASGNSAAGKMKAWLQSKMSFGQSLRARKVLKANGLSW